MLTEVYYSLQSAKSCRAELGSAGKRGRGKKKMSKVGCEPKGNNRVGLVCPLLSAALLVMWGMKGFSFLWCGCY